MTKKTNRISLIDWIASLALAMTVLPEQRTRVIARRNDEAKQRLHELHKNQLKA